MPVLQQPESSQRVAVFRALQLGDMLCAVPALRALRTALPRAHIALIGLPWAQTFVARYPRYIDAFIACPGLPGFPEQARELDRLPAFLARVQAQDFDLAIQLHGDGRLSNVITAWLGARLSVGFYRGDDWAPLDRGLPYPHDLSEVRRLLQLIQWLGAEAQDDALEFPVADTDRASLGTVAAANALTPGDYVCVHPGARGARRRWDATAFARIADALAGQGLRVVLTGSAEEAWLVRAVADAMSAPALNYAGATDLGALAALLAGARLLVCNDTGVSHLAAALRVPSVVLFSGSDARRWAPRDRRRHRPVLAAEPDALARAIAQALNLLKGGCADAA